MPFETILLFLITDLMICLTPGPATMVTLSHALPAGRGGGMRGALGPIVGVNFGNFIWYALTAFGLIAVIQAFPIVYAVLRWIGVIYLIWMGWMMLRNRSDGMSDTAAEPANFKRGFLNGLAVHMSNPKALLFYTAIIPPFIDPTGNLWLQFGILAGLTIITETAGLSFYAALASRARGLGNTGVTQSTFRTIAGIVLIGAAIILASWNIIDHTVQSASFNSAKGLMG